MRLDRCGYCLAFLGVILSAAELPGQQTVLLLERPQVGDAYHVSGRGELSGTLTPPPQPGKPGSQSVPFRGNSVIEYDERVLDLDQAGVPRATVRFCQEMAVSRTVGEQPQENRLRSEVHRLVVMRKDRAKAPFSPDGPLTWTEIDLVRTDVFVPLLAGLLPARAVGVGDTWSVSSSSSLELTGLDRIESGSLECTLRELTPADSPRQARVELRGTLRGTNEDGLTKQEINGYFLFDLESRHLSYLQIRGSHSLLDRAGKEIGRVEGRFVLGRRSGTLSSKISKEALQGVKLEPDERSSLLLYENEEVGIRFLYPRHWRVAGVQGQQVTLETPEGAGLLLTAEPLSRMPSGQDYLVESRQWLEKQRARVLKLTPPRDISGAIPLEYFTMELELGGRSVAMDYYLTRQRPGGVLAAGRFSGKDSNPTRQEAQKIIQSIRVIKTITPSR